MPVPLGDPVRRCPPKCQCIEVDANSQAIEISLLRFE